VAEESGGGKQANPEEEINKYLDILARDPRSRAFAPLAEAYRKAGLLDEAIETSREGLKNHPSYFGGRVALGRALFEKDLFSEAKDEFVQVVQAAPDNLMAQKLLGQAWQQLGNSTEAEKAFRMVLLLDPRDEEAQRSLDSLSGTTPAPAAAFEPPPVKEPPPEPTVAPEPEAPPEDRLESPPPPEPAPPAPEEASEDPFFLEAPEETAPEPEEEKDSIFDDTGETVQEAPPPAAAEEVPEEPPESAAEPTVEPEAEPEAESEPEVELTTSTEPVFDIADMEAMAEAAGEDEDILGEESDSPFEMFTKQPEGVTPPEEPLEESGKGEEIFEQTFEPESLEDGQPEEIPIFDLAEEEEPFQAAAAPPAAPAPPAEESAASPLPSEEEEMHAELEDEMHVFDLGEDLELSDPAAEPAAVVEEAPSEPPAPLFAEEEPESDAVAEMEEEIPTFDLAAEAELAEPAAAVPSAEELEGGTFDTETLAGLYVSQGFYDKAADVYRRMIQDRPDDSRLRQKLEEVLSLQKMESAGTVPAAAPPAAPEPAPPAPPPAPAPEETADEEPAAAEENPVILELQRFLAELKERRK
jgi:tetratricopeptide (TPR) repeat protein